MTKIRLIKLVDRLLGRLLVLLLSFFKAERDGAQLLVRNVLFIRPGGIGDAVLLVPAIKALKIKYPGAEIDILCEKRNSGIFGMINGLRRVYLYDRGADLLRCISSQYDVVVDTEQWHRMSAVIAFMTRAGIRIGFGTNDRSKLFTHTVEYDHDDNEVKSFYRLLEQIEVPHSEALPDVPFLDIEAAEAGKYVEDTIGSNIDVVAIFPGATVRERRWGGERYGEVAKNLNERGYRIVLLGTSDEKEDALKIRQQVRGAVDLTGLTTLREVAYVLKNSALLITADSGLMHMAYALGAPTVSIFGSGIEKKWAPRGECHEVVNKRLDCSPCTRFGYTPSCDKGIRCLSEILPEDVIEATDKLLK
ncbi:MAG: glycosyltransferase family 9 protein [Nitrospirota bacterium]|nr:MAG: glycosyltransferase family 9 protein [Nitrospirota bacterium]